MKKHFSISVSGKVQGVFFRASTKQKADDLAITGNVKNEHNGDVSIEAEGEEVVLNEFIEWCKAGPSQARVDQCVIKENEVKGFKNFVIDR